MILQLRRMLNGQRIPAGLLVPGLILLIMLSGCQATRPGEAADAQQAASTNPPATPLPTATHTPPPPVVVVAATAPSLPAFAAPSAEEIADLQAKAAATEAALVTSTPLPPTGIPPTETPTETPMPTFTPPALPNTPPWEHYWFRRPVAVDGIVWTNKTYPYGSTRGGQLRPHHGVEFDVGYGTEILAVASGTIRVAGSDAETVYGPHTNFYGNLVVIEHDSLWEGKPVFTLYGHLSEPLVVVGQHVDAEQVIGLSGATGVADGPHMHFEVRVGSNSYDATYNPLLWLYPFPGRGTVAGRVTWADGSLATEVPVSLRRIDGESPYHATTTYADDSTNPDDGWNENFALDDVAAGYYEITVEVGRRKFKQEFWVYPYQTSFVEIVIN